MYGSAGTGKTLILCEALKIKLSQLMSQGRRVRILATGFYDRDTTELLNNFRTKYLVNMKNIEFMKLFMQCGKLNIEFNYDTPLETLNRVIRSMVSGNEGQGGHTGVDDERLSPEFWSDPKCCVL